MLSQPAADTLRPLVMTLRIIVLALGLGVTIFGVFAAVQNASKAQTFGTNVNYLFLAVSAPMFIAGFLVPRLLPASLGGSVPGVVSDDSAEIAAVRSIFAAIQTKTIVGCALFEGGAFANLVTYLTDAELVHLAVSGIALLCILAHFPLRGPIEERIENRLQLLRDEQQFKS